jgi:putative hydrolase of the HAD superfamily
MGSETGPRALLLDALGTLVDLPDPGAALVEELAARGVDVRPSEAGWAIGAEIAYYRQHLHHARDAEALHDLRLRCLDVLRGALPAHAREAADLDVLLGSLRFRPYPEAVAALTMWREAGLRLVVVSNWDVSLAEVLERTGLAPLVDGAVDSATFGVAKPDPAIFVEGLRVAGVAASEALYVGDSYEPDVTGARAAGIEPVLVVRGGDAPGGVRVVRALDELRVP